MDSPGIIQPKIYDNNISLKLSICGNIKEKIVGKKLICEYLLHLLNKNNYLDYVKELKTKEKVVSIDKLIKIVSENYNILETNNAFDFVLTRFYAGKLGKVTFDEDINRKLLKL